MLKSFEPGIIGEGRLTPSDPTTTVVGEIEEETATCEPPGCIKHVCSEYVPSKTPCFAGWYATGVKYCVFLIAPFSAAGGLAVAGADECLMSSQGSDSMRSGSSPTRSGMSGSGAA